MANKVIHTSGKRKTAIARATLRPGTGRVKFNKLAIDVVEPKMLRLKLMEPILLAEKYSKNIDFSVVAMGGGQSSQIEAGRLAVARGLVEYTKSEALKNEFLDYERQLLVADVRRRECRKPNTHSKARSKRQKSYR